MIIDLPKNIQNAILHLLETNDEKEIEKFIFEAISNHISVQIKKNVKVSSDIIVGNHSKGKDNVHAYIQKSRIPNLDVSNFSLDESDLEILRKMCIQQLNLNQTDNPWPITLQRFFPIKSTLRIIAKNIAYRYKLDSCVDAGKLWDSFESKNFRDDYWYLGISPAYQIKSLYEYLLVNNEFYHIAQEKRTNQIVGFWDIQRSSIKDFWRRLGGNIRIANQLIGKTTIENQPASMFLNGHLGQMELITFSTTNSGNIELKLTHDGMEFLSLLNPILDVSNGESKNNPQFLSQEEKIWLIYHMHNRPGESLLIENILESFSADSDIVKFSAIAQKVASSNPEYTLSKSRSTAMGAIIRLCEVDVLKRISRGQYTLGNNSFPLEY